MKDYRISTSSIWKVFGIFFVISMILPIIPLWLKLTNSIIGTLFLLAIYNPIQRVNWIWRLKHMIFRPENAEDLRTHIEEGLGKGRIEEEYIHVSFDKEGKRRMGSGRKPFKGWLQGSKKEGNVVDGKKEK